MCTWSCSWKPPLTFKICQCSLAFGLIGLTNYVSILWPKHMLSNITNFRFFLCFWINLLGFFFSWRGKFKVIDKVLDFEHISIESQVFSSQISTKKQRGKISSTPTQPPTIPLKLQYILSTFKWIWKHPLFPPPSPFVP